MASLTTMASFLGGAVSIPGRPSVGRRTGQGLAVAQAAAKDRDVAQPNPEARADGEREGRRAVMLAAAAAAACAIGQEIAKAEEEPKPGTPEAKKKYAPICVTMPTAKICHK
ncbi:Photosystem II 5 kDa protein [Musa troglodytarum]|uniref:Photosystem II 5 kDa protein n=1 Tax=Musa troglodytarum TaxID=320322 RepID=A0A9E7K0N7_9LILI|nr:Photosystem II 5 kDa protein [Musa troglodytarum]